MLFLLLSLFSAFGQECPPETCVTGMGVFAVSDFSVIGVDRAGKYWQVEPGFADSTWSLLDPNAEGVRFSELEGSPGATEWGCGISSTYGFIGNVACWGAGTDDVDDHAPPLVTNPGSGQWQSDVPYTALDISQESGCAIGTSGTVLAWSTASQSTLETNIPTSNEPYLWCSADDSMMCAGHDAGVDCWGNTSLLTTPAPTSGTWVDGSCRGNRDCFFVKNDNTLVYAGYTPTASFTLNAPTDYISKVELNHDGTKVGLALTTTGEVWAWQPDTNLSTTVDAVPMAPGAYSQTSKLRKSVIKFSDIKVERYNACGLVAEDYSGQIECADATTPTVDFKQGDLVCWGQIGNPCAVVLHPDCEIE